MFQFQRQPHDHIYPPTPSESSSSRPQGGPPTYLSQQYPYSLPYTQYPQPGPGAAAVSFTHTSTPSNQNSFIASRPSAAAESAQDDGGSSGEEQTRNQIEKRIWDYSAEGVAEAREKWQAEWADKTMPPPPPEIFKSKDAAVESSKRFAKQHGYVLVCGHTYKNKDGELNRVVMRCEFAGTWGNHHKITPENRQRNRASRKTGCKVKVRLQKKRFLDEWVLCNTEARHNHAPRETEVPSVPSEHPELEDTLFEWHSGELAKGERPHGNSIKAKAQAIFVEMPMYQGMATPDFDRKWLEQYRKRYNLGGKVLRAPGPPPLVDWTNPDDAAAATAALTTGSVQPLTREQKMFAGLESVFPDGKILEPTRKFVKNYMARYDASHDWNHVLRVFVLARQILRLETPAYRQVTYNKQLVLLAAWVHSAAYVKDGLLIRPSLLHDVGDHKYAEPGENAENQIAEVLLENGAEPELAMAVQTVAKTISYQTETKNPRMAKLILEKHPELAIVQDADRLDAIGAVGIGRTFAFGGAKKPDRGLDGSIEHFGDKLVKLESMMKTETGRRLARERTQRLQMFYHWWQEETSMMP